MSSRYCLLLSDGWGTGDWGLNGETYEYVVGRDVCVAWTCVGRLWQSRPCMYQTTAAACLLDVSFRGFTSIVTQQSSFTVCPPKHPPQPAIHVPSISCTALSAVCGILYSCILGLDTAKLHDNEVANPLRESSNSATGPMPNIKSHTIAVCQPSNTAVVRRKR